MLEVKFEITKGQMLAIKNALDNYGSTLSKELSEMFAREAESQNIDLDF